MEPVGAAPSSVDGRRLPALANRSYGFHVPRWGILATGGADVIGAAPERKDGQ